MTKREQQKEQRRILILESALDLFVNKGYGETKITDIAKAANMSIGLLFHYYDSKEKLYEAIIQNGCEYLQMNMNYTDGSPLAFFKYVADDILTMLASNPTAAKMFVLIAQAEHQDKLSPKSKEMLAQGNTLITQCIPLIEKGQSLGEIRQGDPEALLIAFWYSIQGIAECIARNPDAPCPKPDWILSILKEEGKNEKK